MQVAIIFWGLTRSLKLTYPNLRRHIFDVLTRAGIQFDVFMHTYYFAGSYNNVWTGETNVQLDFDEYKILQPKYLIREDQDEVSKGLNLSSYHSEEIDRRDPLFSEDVTWFGPKSYMMVENVVRALYSKYQITKKFETVQNEYNYAMFLRPDADFLSPLDVTALSKADDTHIVLPDFGHYRGVNDQFAITTPRNALVYGKLFERLHAYGFKKSIISERYLKDCLEESGIGWVETKVRYELIRANVRLSTPHLLNIIFGDDVVFKGKRVLVDQTSAQEWFQAHKVSQANELDSRSNGCFDIVVLSATNNAINELEGRILSMLILLPDAGHEKSRLHQQLTLVFDKMTQLGEYCFIYERDMHFDTRNPRLLVRRPTIREWKLLSQLAFC
jgi:hypothetical protein